jgi:AcrR family transcriptional regulator
MIDSAVDIKEQVAEARRTQILMGAFQVFSEKGYHKATTKQIAKAAGVSEGTIYNYFDTKRDLLAAMVDHLGMESLRDLVTHEPPDELHELFAAIIRDRSKLALERGPFLLPLISEVINDIELRTALYRQVLQPVAHQIEVNIQERMDAGQLRQIDPVIVTRSMMGAVVVNLMAKFSGVDSHYDGLTLDEIIERITDLFLNGLLAETQNTAGK